MTAKEKKLAETCRQYVKCDTARISQPNKQMFLIIGFNRNTKDDKGTQIYKGGKKVDFDYVQESVVASGFTEKELIESAKEYQRLCGLTWEQYFKELKKQTNE